MIVNQTTLNSLYKGFKTVFNQALTNTQPLYTKVATEVPSTGKSEEYKWLGKMPRLREWIGERVVQNLMAHGYEIKNRDWEATIEVDRNDIEDDSVGIYTPLVQMLGQSAALHPDDLVFEMLLNGFTNLCYDGQYFFDTDHRDSDGPIQSNKGTASLSLTSYAAARAQMMSLVDERGKSLNINPNLLVVPPQLEYMARRIVSGELIDHSGVATTNVYKGTAEVLVVSQLAVNPTAWFLMDVSKPIKPLIFQRRKKPEFVAKDSVTDDNVFFQKKFVYGVDCRDNAGYGLWQLAYGSTGTE